MSFRDYKIKKYQDLSNKTYGVLYENSKNNDHISNSHNVSLESNNDIEEPIQNLFDGYLGEQKEVPNPLEYGPNATYRNLREGVVYKKGPDNLWEVFVKDGQPGKQGQSIGSGVGVEEVKRIISTYNINNSQRTITVSGDINLSSPDNSTTVLRNPGLIFNIFSSSENIYTNEGLTSGVYVDSSAPIIRVESDHNYFYIN